MNVLNNPSIRRIHCLGVGGVGVSALAELLLDKGYQVSGSDVQRSSRIARLELKGLSFREGHFAENIEGVDCVIYSSAIKSHNPIYRYAEEHHIPLVRRGELLAEVLQSYDSIVVAGTHGKTTTSSIIAHCLQSLKVNPNSIIGGLIRGQDSSVVITKSPYFVVEADESDGSFLHIHSNVAVVTNIDHDHVENYGGDFEKLKQSFLSFLEQKHSSGAAVVCIDDPVVRSLVPTISGEVVTYGAHPDADVRVKDYLQSGMTSTFKVQVFEKEYDANLSLAGEHNMLNALAAIAVIQVLSLDVEQGVKALASFPGVTRRLQQLGSIETDSRSIPVYEDYGHHPVEIDVTIKAVKAAYPTCRLLMIFQPHRFSRTQYFFSDFINVVSQVDELVLLDVDSAGETSLENADSASLLKSLVELHPDLPCRHLSQDLLFGYLSDCSMDNDVILFQGAGSVGKLALDFVQLPEFC